jgi:hypothetical protein
VEPGPYRTPTAKGGGPSLAPAVEGLVWSLMRARQSRSLGAELKSKSLAELNIVNGPCLERAELASTAGLTLACGGNGSGRPSLPVEARLLPGRADRFVWGTVFQGLPTPA